MLKLDWILNYATILMHPRRMQLDLCHDANMNSALSLIVTKHLGAIFLDCNIRATTSVVNSHY